MGAFNQTTALRFLRIGGLLGCAVFAGLLALVLENPKEVERGARAFILAQVERQVRGTAELAQSVPGALEALSKRYGADLSRIDQKLDNDLPARIAEQVAQLSQFSPAQQKGVEKVYEGLLESRAREVTTARNVLNDLIHTTYFRVIESLWFDLRLFLTSNAVAFLLVALLTFLPGKPTPLLLPSGLLAVLTVAGCLAYLFGQNWFYTIIFGSYWGGAYAGCLAAVYGLCIDIAFNKGRITNVLSNTVGSVFSGG